MSTAEKKASPERVVYATRDPSRFILDRHPFPLPEGMEFVPSGDAALTRRLKAAYSEQYILVKRRLGRREIGVGMIVPAGSVAPIAGELAAERETPEYQQRLAAGRRRREEAERQYAADFEAAVAAFLAFHPRWRELAAELASVITAFTVPVGSGTVARTERIPLADRARAAVIAWMRHQTTGYDDLYIPRVRGRRREVRRELAQESLALLERYRRGLEPAPDCPLQLALRSARAAK